MRHQCTNREKLFLGSQKPPGCQIVQHPDDENRWFCLHCQRQFIEDPGFNLFPVIFIPIILFLLITAISSSDQTRNSQNNQNSQFVPVNECISR
jgi:hypothetical protein